MSCPLKINIPDHFLNHLSDKKSQRILWQTVIPDPDIHLALMNKTQTAFNIAQTITGKSCYHPIRCGQITLRSLSVILHKGIALPGH
ncbi:hypothetical protein PDESU_03423 [Pontiella desulfatans]|uniref:Uncharacterized protein n=1 Tax=Pontiella desulfatans TaxID=2750659 RepID=A0A6C2U4P5_PONDE|nr:hypothetical protein PDESU_03423 [Pontiella desulfatans]